MLGRRVRGWGLGLALAAAASLLLCGALAMAEEGESAGAEPPATPTNLSTRALWSGIVDVQWDEASGTERYELQVFLLDRWVELPGAGIEAAYYGAGAVLRGLPPSRSLEVRVRSQNAAGSSDWSALLFVPQTDRPGAWSGVPEPSNAAATGRPRIVGRARVGERLEAETGAIADANGLERVRLHYQWTLSRGGEEREIAGATGASYTLTESELGERVGLRVWFWDRQGFYESLTSAATAAVEPWTHWSGRMTVGYANDVERMAPALHVGGEVYGVGLGYGALEPGHFQWRGASVLVVVLGMHIDEEGEPSVHVMLSRELPDNYELHLGGRSFALSEARHPEAAGYAYQWDGERFSWTEGQTVEASITSPYPPLTLELTSSRELCTAGTLTELSWNITGGKPPYTLTIDGETVDAEAESRKVNCGPIPTDPVTGESSSNPTKTFSASVVDSRGEVAAAEIWVALTALAYPDETRILRYETHDPTGAAAMPGSYAFLAGSGDEDRSVGTYEALRDGTATELRINVSDAAGASQAGHFDAVAVGDIVEWREADDCFVRYKVTAIEAGPPDVSSKRFTIEWMTYAFTGCSGPIAADASVTMNFGSLPHLGGPELTAPVVHGVYQIVPVGWTGARRPLESSEFTKSYPEVYTTTNAVEARQMRHWRELSVPAGWRFRKAEEGGFRESPTDGYCAWYVTATGAPGLKVCGNKGSLIWYGAGESAWHNGTSVDETRVVAGRPATVIYSTTDPYFPLTLGVYDAATQVEYTIYGGHRSVRGKNVDAVIAIAESLFAGSPPFGSATSASPTSSAARGTSQAHVLFEFDVFAGAPAGTTKVQTSGWHGSPSGEDDGSYLDDGALDIGAVNGNAVHLLVEPGHFVPSTPFDHVAGRVAEIVTPTDKWPKHYCARVEVEIYRFDGTDEVTLGRLYYVHVIPFVRVGERIILSGRGPISYQLGTVAAASWMDPVSFSQAYANRSWPMDDNVVQLQVIGNQTYKVMYTSLLGQWLEWRWPLGSKPPDNAEREECVTTGDHLHQGADGPAVWPNKNSTAHKGNDLPAYEDDGFGFDPDGDGYAAPERSFCSDTWLAKIRSLLSGPPLASPVSDCGAPDNAPVDLAAAPGHETLNLTWTAPALVAGEDDPISGYRVRWRQVTPTDTAWSGWAETDTSSSHELTALTNGNTYAAQVQAINAGGVGPPSTVTAAPTSLEAPTNVRLTVSGDDLNGTFDWTGKSPKFVRWELHRADDEDGTNSQVVGARLTFKSPVEFNNQERGYWYRIRGRACARLSDIGRGEQSAGPRQQPPPEIEVCGNDWSDWPDWLEVSSTIPMCMAPGARSSEARGTASDCVPGTPGGLEVDPVSDTSATLHWDDVVGATGYKVRRNGLATTVSSVGDVNSHPFTLPTPGTSYKLEVAATNELGESEFASLTLLVPPTLNTPHRAVGFITLSWQDDENATDHNLRYEAFRVAAGADCPRMTADDSRITATSFTFEIDEADRGARHRLCVRARNDQGPSAWRSVTSWTKLPSPSGVDATAFTSVSAEVSWDKVAHAGSYELKVVTAADCAGTETPEPVGQPSTGTTVSTSISLSQPQTTYRFCVRAVQTVGTAPNQVTRRSDWSFDTGMTLAVPALTITSATTTWRHCVKGVDRVPVDWSAEGGEPPYTTNGVLVDADTVTLLCPLAVGAGTLRLVVTDSGSPARSARADVAITATEVLSFDLDDSALGCETGDTIAVGWRLSGGAAGYTVTLPDGSTVTASAGAGGASYECPSRAGTQTLTYSVVDSSHPAQTDSDSLTVAISEPEPDPLVIERAETS